MHVGEHVGVHVGVRGCVRVCMGVCRCAQVCEDMLWASARVAACVDVCNVHGCGWVRVHMGMQWCAVSVRRCHCCEQV